MAEGHSPLTGIKQKHIPSLFWGMMMGLSGLSMLYLLMKGYFADIQVAKDVAIIMLFMAGFGIVLSAGRVFWSEKHLVQSCVAFLVGFVSWTTIASFGGTGNAMMKGGEFVSQYAPKMTIFSQFQTVSLDSLAQIDPFWVWYVPNIINPIVEEMLWGVGLPIFLILMMKGMGNASRGIRNPYVSMFMKAFNNPIVQTAVLITILPLSFAIFHVGKQASALFLIAAITFRGILTVMWWGDLQWDIIPFLLIVPSFLVGSHMGNNIGTTGFWTSVDMAMSHPVGWATLGVFGFISFIGFLGIIEDLEFLETLLR